MGWFELFLPLAALALDLIFKDFRSFPHPVQGVAWLAGRLELRARRFESRGLVCLPGIAELQAGFLSGGACLAVILIVTGGAVFILGELPFVGIILTVYFAYAGLALGGLLREGRIALGAVMQGEISEARQAVSMLVSRDLSQAGRPVLLKTLAETLSENFNDALIAPFFWLLTGGPVGLWMYKAVSTMDSLWGYRTEKWRYLGFAAARFDDLLAFIPARLSSWLLCFFSRFVPHFGRWPGYARVKADALKMESPNAGWGMAAAAWLHHGQMGGRAVYFGEVKEKPLLGPGNDDKSSGFEWNEEKIRNLLRHIKIAGIGGCILMWGVWCLFRLIFFWLS